MIVLSWQWQTIIIIICLAFLIYENYNLPFRRIFMEKEERRKKRWQQKKKKKKSYSIRLFYGKFIYKKPFINPCPIYGEEWGAKSDKSEVKNILYNKLSGISGKLHLLLYSIASSWFLQFLYCLHNESFVIFMIYIFIRCHGNGFMFMRRFSFRFIFAICVSFSMYVLCSLSF